VYRVTLRQDIKLLVDGCENLWVEIHTPKNEKNIIIGIIYRHPHSNISAFKDALSDKLEHSLNENKQLIIIGDINIDLIKCETRARNNGQSTINDRQEIVFYRRRSNVAVHLDRQEIYLTIV
jgi:hypothetical protein